MKRIPLLLLSVLLASCGSIYRNPPEQPGKTARLKSSSSSPLFGKTHYTVQSIDDREVSYNMTWTTATKKIVVTEGRHNVVIRGHFRDPKTDQPATALCDIDLDAKADRIYEATGKPEGKDLVMWLRDAETGQPASKKIKTPYSLIQLQAGPPVMIFLPN